MEPRIPPSGQPASPQPLEPLPPKESLPPSGTNVTPQIPTSGERPVEQRSIQERRITASDTAPNFLVPQQSRTKRVVSALVGKPVLYLLKKSRSLISSAPPLVRLADRAIGYLSGLSPTQGEQLTRWVSEAANDSEKSHRLEASHRIMNAVNQGSSTINLCDLSLGSLPDTLWELSWISSLRLASCKLNSLPAEVSALKNLKVLDLGYNQLTELPAEIISLKRLEQLCVGYNALSTLPDGLGRLKHLEHLELQHNLFERVPDQLLELEQHEPCRILFYNNNPTPMQVAEWMFSHRTRDMDIVVRSPRKNVAASRMSLNEKLQLWFHLAGKRLPDNFEKTFSERTLTALNVYLVKLMEFKDYSNPSKAREEARTLITVLEQMQADPDIMAACTEHMIEINETCADGALQVLNDMYVAARFAKIQKEGTLQDLVELKRGELRLQKVEELVEETYQKQLHDYKHSQGPKPDHVEVKLIYLLELQKALDLPIPPGQKMRYAAYSYVTRKMLNDALATVKAYSESMNDGALADELLLWPPFKARMQQDYAGYEAKLSESFHERLEDVYQLDSDEEIRTRSEALRLEQNAATDKLYKDIAIDIIHGNPRKPYTQKDYLDDQ
ncbi:NEL-type E3 ubiquitin ligase domain-containing protein [Parendozoicomonas haliclonae]|uniref:RING-type E3 ubiquitin transferase n=1 Tax=Parendozoicomonas haliclonae TaxID=1960125 RepID=A0A1X7AL74_9GAMM|nr:NEL-type E3 ubiquitin ligase domain-containing protein [Parendozoicomonas haliclonae]SMA48191.1 E3 ubiquitin-protein ligase sspH1 [Parendozoicomonas haliclonae]